MKRSTLARLEQLERKRPAGHISAEQARAQLCAALLALAAEQQPSRTELTGPHAELLTVLERLG